MFNKLDDADCVAKKMELPTLNDGGDRSSVNQPFVLCCRSQANVPGHPPLVASCSLPTNSRRSVCTGLVSFDHWRLTLYTLILEGDRPLFLNQFITFRR
jgi:hypothetical protein